LAGCRRAVFRDQVLEVRNVEGRLHIARKERRHDEWDPPIALYDPYVAVEEILEA